MVLLACEDPMNLAAGKEQDIVIQQELPVFHMSGLSFWREIALSM
jgi:hypothetical protein